MSTDSTVWDKNLLLNDLKILDAHRRHQPRDGMWTLTFPGDYMPLGQNAEFVHKGELSRAVLREFCDYVRSEYERQAGEKAAPGGADNARDAGVSEGDTAPDERGGSGGGGSAPYWIAEDALEEYLQSEINGVRDRIRVLDGEISQREEERASLNARLDRAERALIAASDSE